MLTENIENNPTVMTKLSHRLGLSSSLFFQDVFSLTEPELLTLVPRPCLALLFLYPITEESEKAFRSEQASQPEYKGSGPDEPVMWCKQTIGSACGLIGLLHCITNGEAATHIQVDSDLDNLVKAALSLRMKERADLLYNSEMLEQAHQEAAQTGDSKAPTSDERVGYGFTAFVKGKDGHFWELEGRRNGPLDRGLLAEDEDVLSENALRMGPLRIINQEKAVEGRFSCLALVAA